MADDIDDLLDEVESKYCSKSNKADNRKKCPTVSKQSTQTKASTRNKSFTDDISSAIDDIMADDGFDIKVEKGAKANKERTSSIGSSGGGGGAHLKLKCSSIHVGGSKSQLGASTSTTSSQCCNRLHCTSCDNQIVFFDDLKWNEEKCDYLAFRNNYPDYERLKYLLLPRKGYRAYCCQCSWLSSKDIAVLLRNVKPDFKWVCKKH